MTAAAKHRGAQRWPWIAAAAAVAAAAVAGALGRGTPQPQSLPELLSDTGLFTAGSVPQIDARNLPFVPQYPLWSDGATKRRWIRLPEGRGDRRARSRRLAVPRRHALLERVQLRAARRDALHGAARGRKLALCHVCLGRRR